jgi:hypothetical protein
VTEHQQLCQATLDLKETLLGNADHGLPRHTLGGWLAGPGPPRRPSRSGQARSTGCSKRSKPGRRTAGTLAAKEATPIPS